MLNVTQRSNSPRASALWLALTGFPSATTARAAPVAEDMTGVKVTCGDLDIASKQGNQVLLAGIAKGGDSGERGVRAGGHARCDPRVTESDAQFKARRGAARS